MKKLSNSQVRRLSELVSSQNASIDTYIDRIVEKAAVESTFAERPDQKELKKTTELLVMNSLILGDTDR